MRNFVRCAASFFGVGFIPVTPATWASLLAAGLGWLAGDSLLFWALGISALGILICAPAQEAFGHKDPPAFVLDEVAGMLVGLLCVPREPGWFAAAFVLFRFYDAAKPGPILWLQNRKHASSIVTDDLLAGVFTALTVQALLLLWRLI